jgi:hypothetical protein
MAAAYQASNEPWPGSGYQPDWKGLASGFGEFFVSRLELTECGGHLPVAAARNRIRSGACWLLPSIVDRANLPTGPSFQCRARIDQAPVSAGWGGEMSWRSYSPARTQMPVACGGPLAKRGRR